METQNNSVTHMDELMVLRCIIAAVADIRIFMPNQ